MRTPDRLFVLLLVAALASPAPGFAQTPADQPVRRTDQNSETARLQLLEKAKKGRIDIYFQGDSITRRWGATDYPDFLAHWRESFFGWNAANFAWGGDTTQNILWRLNNGELDGINPKVIVLLAGTNNLGGRIPEGREEERAADVARGIRAVLNAMQSKAPDATIILMGIFPRNDNMAALPVINRINNTIAAFADGRKIRYLNINGRLADSNGKLYEGMMPDGLHPAIRGYQVWADALKPLFTELLGPPAKTDLAPPPTGDPSARPVAALPLPAGEVGAEAEGWSAG
jgi:lysophospholipase L1-like esterase